jgi:hypothetical protein
MLKLIQDRTTSLWLVRALHGSWTTIASAETRAAALQAAKPAIARQKRLYRDDGDTGAVLAWDRIERALVGLCEAERVAA